MQVSVEKTSELSRKMTVNLPEEMIQEKMDDRFKKLAREIKIDGFRPGKAPVRVVKKMYGDRVRGEIAGDLIQSSYYEALKDQDLVPAGQPHIHPGEAKEGLEYTAEFEVYPEIVLDNLSTMEIKRPIAEVEQADQDAMIAKLREQRKTWNAVERVAEQGDQVTINFSGISEGENFTDGKVEDFTVEIGAGKMIPGFEDELIGMQPGSNKSIEITFPDDYGNEKLAGKKAEFEIELIKVEEASLPEIDEDFIKAYGVNDGSLDAFNADVKANMERELAKGLKNKLKVAVLDELLEKVSVTVPNALVDQEIQQMMKPYEEDAKKNNIKLEDMDLPKDMFEEQARRRVSLGLILGEIIRQNDITVDEDGVRAAVEELSVTYERPEDVISWYYADEQRLNDVRQMVLEEQTVDWIVNQAKVTEEKVNFDDVMDKQQS